MPLRAARQRRAGVTWVSWAVMQLVVKVRRQEWAGRSAGTVAQALGWRPEEWEG